MENRRRYFKKKVINPMEILLTWPTSKFRLIKFWETSPTQFEIVAVWAHQLMINESDCYFNKDRLKRIQIKIKIRTTCVLAWYFISLLILEPYSFFFLLRLDPNCLLKSMDLNMNPIYVQICQVVKEINK